MVIVLILATRVWAPCIETLLALGKERQKSKVIPCTLNPKWREGFDLYWQEDTDDQMEITIWDRDVGAKDDFIGM